MTLGHDRGKFGLDRGRPRFAWVYSGYQQIGGIWIAFPFNTLEQKRQSLFWHQVYARKPAENLGKFRVRVRGFFQRKLVSTRTIILLILSPQYQIAIVLQAIFRANEVSNF